MSPVPAGEILGDGSESPELIIVHGFGQHPSDMYELASRITAPGSRAFLPVMRGSGFRHDDAGWSPFHHAGDLQTACQELGPHHVVGYSYGASAAAAYAIGVGPRRVRSLVLIDQAFEAQPSRTEPPPWTEANDLLWHYDYSHHVALAAHLGIPVLFLIGKQSHVIPQPERARWRTASTPRLTVIEIDGDHGALVCDRASAAPYIADFIASVKAGAK